MMRFRNVIYILLICSSFILGCLSGGTHGSVKSYTYPIKKDSLQKAVMSVIKNNPNISRDTTLDYLGSSPLLDSASCYNCVAGDNYYNDIKHYVTIKISSGQDVNQYTFRYYGADKDWDVMENSRLFICYAHDKYGNGGSEGNGGITNELSKKLVSVFEKEFILKVDKKLNLDHSGSH